MTTHSTDTSKMAATFARSLNRKAFLRRASTMTFAGIAGLMGINVRSARAVPLLTCDQCSVVESPFCSAIGHGNCCSGWSCVIGNCPKCFTCNGNNCWCVTDNVSCQTRCCCDCRYRGSNCADGNRCICTAQLNLCRSDAEQLVAAVG